MKTPNFTDSVENYLAEFATRKLITGTTGIIIALISVIKTLLYSNTMFILIDIFLAVFILGWGLMLHEIIQSFISNYGDRGVQKQQSENSVNYKPSTVLAEEVSFSE